LNPFRYGTVVKEPYFFNRQEDQQRIVDTLKGGNNLVLYAPRRYGKTSLVMKAIDSLEKLGYRCIYFDFMTVYSIESFIKTFSKAILTKQSNWKRALQSFSEFVKNVKPTLTFDEKGSPEFSIEFTESSISDNTLDTIIDLPENLAHSKHPFIVIMDEFQDIQKLNGEYFENILRSKIQHDQNTNYLFLGSRIHLLKDMFTNKNRPFYNSATTMSIDVLPQNETVEFLIDRFSQSNMILDKKTARYLIEKAGKIPYYIQLLASEIWQYTVNAQNRINKEVIEICANKILDLKNDFYFELFDNHTAYQKKLLKALAINGQHVFSRDYARKFRLSAPSTTQKAITGLIDSGLIEKQADEYTFSDPFFRWFILRLPA